LSKKEKTEVVFEDIASYSTKAKKSFSKEYAEGSFKNIDKVIKVIAFIVSICVFLVFAAIAAILILLDKMFLAVAVGVLVIGIVISLIFLYLIYGTGHIISQNKEILKRLD